MLNSCELYESLDELPPNQLVKGNLFVNAEAAEAVLNGVYYELLSDGYFGVVTLPSIMSSDMEDLFRGGVGSNRFSSDNFELTAMYSSFYILIDRANNVIQGVNGMDASLFNEKRKNEILGEAHFLRAMGHFDALRFFGHFFDVDSEYGATLRELPVILENKDKARSSVLESYNFILSDLDYAIANVAQNADRQYYANKFTAQALKSRVQLYWASANNHDAQKYQEAVNIADEVLKDGGYTLGSSYPNIFAGASSEIIFETFEPERNRSLNRILKLFSVADGGRYAASESFSKFIETDPRSNFIITSSGSSLRDHIIKYNERDVLFLSRATELILIKAEAYARLKNDDQAKVHLNKVRENRGLAPVVGETGNALLFLIYAEIRRDLSYENGHEWFALVRQGLEAVQTVAPDITSENFLTLPIPTREILNNILGKQNPEYETQIN